MLIVKKLLRIKFMRGEIIVITIIYIIIKKKLMKKKILNLLIHLMN